MTGCMIYEAIQKFQGLSKQNGKGFLMVGRVEEIGNVRELSEQRPGLPAQFSSNISFHITRKSAYFLHS